MHVESIAAKRSLTLESSATEHVMLLLSQDGAVNELEVPLDTIVERLLHLMTAVWSWLVHTLPDRLWHIFCISASWTFQAFWSAGSYVRCHPHPFHILGWSLFFGPIILLVPFLLLLELLILILFQLGFLSHGLALGPVEDRFDSLKEYFMEWREGIFATIEHWTATFNTWTTKYPLLLILRLLGGSLGLFIFIQLYTGWR